MKILAAVAFGLSMQAQATDATEICVSIGQLGKTIMERRQEGTDIGKMLELAQTFETQTERDITKAIIMDAYKQPQYSSQDYRDNAAIEFYNSIVVGCLQSYS